MSPCFTRVKTHPDLSVSFSEILRLGAWAVQAGVCSFVRWRVLCLGKTHPSLSVLFPENPRLSAWAGESLRACGPDDVSWEHRIAPNPYNTLHVLDVWVEITAFWEPGNSQTPYKTLHSLADFLVK